MTQHEAAQFTFDGEPIAFAPGVSVGAALTAAGIRSWRATRVKQKPRGIFCGIGICFDCLIVADGIPNERACLLMAQPGMTVTTQQGTGHDNQDH